jgi:hypothetical protein
MDPEEKMEEEYREQEMLRKAVGVADRIICEGCGGDNDKLLLLTVELSRAFAEKARIMAQQVVDRKVFFRKKEEEIAGL